MDKKNLQLLVVATEKEMQRTLQKQLKQNGLHSVKTVGNAYDAEKLRQKIFPDIYIIDTDLSSKKDDARTGYELCQALRLEKGGHKIGIIGMGPEEYREQWDTASADLYFTKEQIIQPEVLLQSIDTLYTEYFSSRYTLNNQIDL